MDISIVTIAKNEEETLGRVIRSIKSQKSKSKYEIIVVSDGSSDGTVNEALKQNVKIIALEKSCGIATARNIGVLESVGEIIIFLDAHIVLDQNALARFAEIFRRNSDIQGVCGGHNTPFGGLSNIRNIRYKALSGKKDFPKIINLNNFATFSAGIGAFRREIFDEIGFFDESFRGKSGEDIFFELKALNQNYQLFYEPKIQGIHYHQIKNAQDLFKRGLREVRGFYGNLQRGLEENMTFPSQDKYYFRFPFFVAIILFLSIWFKSFVRPLLIIIILESLSIRAIWVVSTGSVKEKFFTFLYWWYCELLKIFLLPIALFPRHTTQRLKEIEGAVIMNGIKRKKKFLVPVSEKKLLFSHKSFLLLLKMVYIFFKWDINKILNLTK